MSTQTLEDGLVQDAPRRFVLVTGAGRSGTSTAAGTLNMLGLHVPPPFLDANESNPRGFFESKWPVQFHNQLMRSAYVAVVDSRPDSVDKVMAAVEPDHRERLRTWLGEVTGPAPQTAVKDPRAAWTIDLWSQTVADLGMQTGYLTMLRHPAEVVGSRATYYASYHKALDARGLAIKNLAGWVNSNLITERQTREQRRAFVRYDDLLGNWRTAMSAVGDDLDLRFNTDLATVEAHPVDDFIDPSLQRHRFTWAEVDVPDQLREVASDVWDACVRLAERHGCDEDAQAELDDVSARYTSLCNDAQALSYDASAAGAKEAGATSARKVRSEMRKKLAESDARAKAAESASRPLTLSRVAASIRRRIRSRVRPR